MNRRFRKPEVLNQILPASSSVIEASAGTGKTYTIEHLVLGLLLEGQATIDQILVVTFTEAAAAELRTRIRTTIIESLSPCEPTDPGPNECAFELGPAETTRLETALNDFDRAQVATIHGFCQMTLREKGRSAGLGGDLQLADESLLRNEVFYDLLRTDVFNDEDLAPWMTAYLKGGGVSSLKSRVFKLQREDIPVRPQFDPTAWENALTRYREVRSQIDSQDEALKKVQAIYEIKKKNAAELTQLRNLDNALAEILPSEDTVPSQLAALSKKTLNVLAERFGDRALGDDPLIEEWIDAALQLADHHVSAAVIAVQRIAVKFTNRYREVKRARGLIDFDDMIIELDQLITQDAEVLASLRERFRVGIIDEFQDTDSRQWSIFRQIFAEDDARLHVVGDPKQSIYSFRGADLSTYFDATKTLVDHGGVRCVLDTNYRSTPSLVGALNGLYASQELIGARNPDCEPVHGKGQVEIEDRERPDFGAVTTIELRRHNDPDELKIDVAKKRFSEFVAAECRRLLHTAQHRKDDETRSLRPSDILVLVKKWDEAEAVAEALAADRIPVEVRRKSSLFASAEAAEVQILIESFANPDDDAARLAALATSFFDAPLDELDELVSIPFEDDRRRRLGHWADLAAKGRFESMARGLLDDSGYAVRRRFGADGAGQLARMRALFDELLRHTREKGDDLKLLLARWKRLRSGSESDTEGISPALDPEAVAVMTIHGSKGLEAPIVFIAGGWSDRENSDVVRRVQIDGQRHWVIGSKSDLSDQIQISLDEESEDERGRLLYVALTRAAARLYLPYVHPAEDKTFKLGDKALLAPLFARISELIESDSVPEGLCSGLVDAPAAAEDDPGPAEPWLIRAEDLQRSPEPSTVARAKSQCAPRLITSYSGLKKRLRDALDLTDREEFSTPKTDSPLPPGRESGLYVHDLFEKTDWSLVSDASESFTDHEGTREIAQSAALRWGLSPEAAKEGLRLTWQTLNAPLKLGEVHIDRLALVERNWRELTFAVSLPDGDIPGLGEAWEERFAVSSGFLRGAIDLVMEHDGQYFIVDWKTDLLDRCSDDDIDRHVTKHYEIQADVYAQALSRLIGIRDHEDHERRFGGVAYIFCRHRNEGGVWFQRPGFVALREAEQRLATMTAASSESAQ